MVTWKHTKSTFTLVVVSPDFWTFQNSNRVSNTGIILESLKVRIKHCQCERTLKEMICEVLQLHVWNCILIGLEQ